MQDTVFHQQGLLICKAESTDSTVDSLCVVDVVKMVMLACQMDVEDDCLKNKQWHWLGTFLYCKFECDTVVVTVSHMKTAEILCLFFMISCKLAEKSTSFSAK